MTSYLRGQIERELQWVLGEDSCSSMKGDLQAAAADWSWMSKFLQYKSMELPAPDFVVWPKSTQEVQKVVQLASDYCLPVIPRGGGSGTQGGTFAPYGGIVIDLSKLNQIIDIDEKSLVATVQAGVVGPVLEKELNEKGLTLSHYPGSYYHGAQIGGYVAARGSGVVSTKYGKAENMVLQIEAVVPPGRIIKTLPVPSHATGPDLLQVFTGSEGTLGVITELSMRLDPMPPSRSFQAFSFPDIFAGMEAGRLIMTSRLRPAVIRLYDKPASEKLANWVGTGFHGNLMVIVCDGVDELVKYESRSIHELCIRAGGTFIGPEIAETWWVGKYEPYAQGKLPVPPVLYGTFDTVARFRDIPRIYEAKKKIIEEEFAEYNAHYTAHLSHWYEWGAMLYDRFYIDKAPDDPAEALELHDRLWNAGVGASLANGGAVNEHHGIGLKLGRFMRPQFGEAFELLKGLKNAWDPQGIMNPGKLGLGPPSGQRIPE